MSDASVLGAKLRALRRRESMSQGQLAQKLGVSASYLNLIENGRRPLPAHLLIKLAQIFQLDLASFAADDDARLAADLLEAFGDPMFEGHGLTSAELRDVAVSSPNLARAVRTLYRAYQGAKESASALAERVSDGGEASIDLARLPSEEVSDLIQRHMNYFPELEESAERVWRDAALDEENVWSGLGRYLQRHFGIEVEVVKAGSGDPAMRRFDPSKKRIALSEVMPPRSRRFQLAHQVGLLVASSSLDSLSRDENLSNAESKALARVALANYFASALLMPYRPFLEAARAHRYDIELLAHRFRTSFEQVCHRMTTLRRAGHEGVPFHFLRLDIAGNISKRFSGSGIRFARFAGACSRWNIHTAFLTPGLIRVQVSRFPEGTTYFCIARTVRSDRGGYHEPHTVHAIGMGCEVRFAKELVYSDGVDLESADAVVPVGVTCRICERVDCAQRVFPPIHQPLRIDENVRGVSFYSPVVGADGAE